MLLVGTLALGLLTSACEWPGRDRAGGAVWPAASTEVHTFPSQASQTIPASHAATPLAARIATILQEAEGTYGIVVEHPASGERVVHNPSRVFRSASVYKLAVACEVLRRVDAAQLGLDDPLVIEPEDAVEPEPAGGPGPGEAVSVRQAINDMLTVSSNTAAHALLRQLDRSQFNAAIHTLGLRATRVPIEPDEAAVTTPADMAHLLGLLARAEILSDRSRRTLREWLALPKPLDPLVATLPPGTPVFAKPGELESASNVAGLIGTPTGTLTLAIFSEDVDPGDARATIGEIARAAYDSYSR